MSLDVVLEHIMWCICATVDIWVQLGQTAQDTALEEVYCSSSQPCLTSRSPTSPPTWTATRCSTNFGGWTIASVRVLALVLLVIHSVEEKLWTFVSTAGARWLMWAILSAPTSVFACALRTSALCPHPKDLQFAFASTKSLQVVMDGVASSSLTGLPILATRSGCTTSSAWVWAFLLLKPMVVLYSLWRQRSCASRVVQNWPCLWRAASCAPWWALAFASGSSVLCHRLRELRCSFVSTFWTRKDHPQSLWHMVPRTSWHQLHPATNWTHAPLLAAPLLNPSAEDIPQWHKCQVSRFARACEQISAVPFWTNYILQVTYGTTPSGDVPMFRRRIRHLLWAEKTHPVTQRYSRPKKWFELFFSSLEEIAHMLIVIIVTTPYCSVLVLWLQHFCAMISSALLIWVAK